MADGTEHITEFVNSGRNLLDSIEQSIPFYFQLEQLNVTLSSINTRLNAIDSNIADVNTNFAKLKTMVSQSEENAKKRLYNSQYCISSESEINWIEVIILNLKKIIFSSSCILRSSEKISPNEFLKQSKD